MGRHPAIGAAVGRDDAPVLTPEARHPMNDDPGVLADRQRARSLRPRSEAGRNRHVEKALRPHVDRGPVALVPWLSAQVGTAYDNASDAGNPARNP